MPDACTGLNAVRAVLLNSNSRGSLAEQAIENTMLNITLNHCDCIETLLPTMKSAMETGEVCQIRNINYLGIAELAALKMLAMADNLMDSGTGKICRANPGFHLVGIDEYGTARMLT